MPMSIVVNGRFRLQRVTGVQRYAREITSRLAERLEVLEPRSSSGGWRGHLWEQFSLGRQTAGNLLWSPCGTGPLGVSRQVVTIHDCAFRDFRRAFSRAFAAWYGWLVPRLARRVRRILTVSEFSRRRIVEICGVSPEKVAVVPNGVSTQFYPRGEPEIEEVRGRWSLPPRYVLCVGSLDPRKNLGRLLEAWAAARLGSHECRLVLAGAASHVFRGVGLEQAPEYVQALGYVPDEDLPALYSGAEAFVYPSLYEGFGLPVIEALACGAPVVCSNDTALAEIAGDAAVPIDPRSTADLTAALARVMGESGLRVELRKQGPVQAARFSWDRCAAETWQVLEAAA